MGEVEFTVKKFKGFLKERRIMAAKCKRCGAVNLPPRPLCKKCHGSELEWFELEGKGKLVTFSVVHVPPTLLVSEGYGRDKPYAFGIVDLGQGARITARLVGFNLGNPESIRLGLDVEAEFINRNGETILAFKPASN